MSRTRPLPRLGTVVAVGAGGTVGGLARYGVGRGWPAEPGEFPWSTFGVNVAGALVLGLIVTLVVERWPPTRFVRPFIGIGLCGGVTTWSTFMSEAVLLVRDDRAALAATYVTVTLVLGLVATYMGVWLARSWPRKPRGNATARRLA